MKKILLTLGSLTAVVVPVASVVACGQPTINVTFPADSTKKAYNVNATASIEAGENGLINLFKNIQKQELEQLPDDVKKLKNDIKAAQLKANTITSETEGVALVQDILQKSINIVWSKALLHETLKLTFVDPTDSTRVTTDTTTVTADTSLILSSAKDDFQNINKDNAQQKMAIIKQKEIDALADEVANLLGQLKTNGALIAWSNSLGTGTLEDRVVINTWKGNITLGSTKEQIKSLLGSRSIY